MEVCANTKPPISMMFADMLTQAQTQQCSRPAASCTHAASAYQSDFGQMAGQVSALLWTISTPKGLHEHCQQTTLRGDAQRQKRWTGNHFGLMTSYTSTYNQSSLRVGPFTNAQTHRHKHRHTHTEADRETDRQTDRQKDTDRETDKQTDRPH